VVVVAAAAAASLAFDLNHNGGQTDTPNMQGFMFVSGNWSKNWSNIGKRLLRLVEA
jgi:hypothetical protein